MKRLKRSLGLAIIPAIFAALTAWHAIDAMRSGSVWTGGRYQHRLVVREKNPQTFKWVLEMDALKFSILVIVSGLGFSVPYLRDQKKD
jgi:hypothetical protein